MNEIETEEVDVDKLSEKVKRLSVLIKKCKAKLHKTEEEVQQIIDDLVEQLKLSDIKKAITEYSNRFFYAL